jgi:hypothetical protein
MTEEERIQWQADRLQLFAPDLNPVIEAALMKRHLAFREHAARPTEENAKMLMRACDELEEILHLTHWQPSGTKQ